MSLIAQKESAMHGGAKITKTLSKWSPSIPHPFSHIYKAWVKSSATIKELIGDIQVINRCLKALHIRAFPVSNQSYLIISYLLPFVKVHNSSCVVEEFWIYLLWLVLAPKLAVDKSTTSKPWGRKVFYRVPCTSGPTPFFTTGDLLEGTCCLILWFSSKRSQDIGEKQEKGEQTSKVGWHSPESHPNI